MRYCVIMCGGVGSRFWPFSREACPKQFLDFFGTGRSLLQMTYDRVLSTVPASRIFLLSNRRYADLIREQLPDVPEENLLFEPARRNTAPCICWAAHHIHALDPDASIVTLPSDHLVLKEQAFIDAIERGLDFVEQGERLLTLGIKPSSPHTGYGYIQQGEPVKADDCEHSEAICDTFKVKSFTEKPDLSLAKVFLSSGEFYWNAGIFLWRADTVLKAFERHAPEIAQLFDMGNDVYGTPQEQEFIERNFGSSPSISIDYAIMEKAENVYVETVDIGWSDLGSWKALYETSPRDRSGNVTQNCRVLSRECHDTVFAVSDPGKIIVASGLDGYVVADSGNALLIYPISEEQQIRQVTNDVKEHFGEDYV